MLSQLHTATLIGVHAESVEVEVDVRGGIPAFHIVGLANGAVREGSVRILSALDNSGLALGPSRVTVNLAPADLRKDGGAFDLPIALGALCAKGIISIERNHLLIAGELALDGRLRSIRGALSFAEHARSSGLEGILLPEENSAEAMLVEGIDVYGVKTLAEAVEVLGGQRERNQKSKKTYALKHGALDVPDFQDVCGQPQARRAAEIAAAGGHNLMLIGPPGAGKTMIARRVGSILPPMTQSEAVDATRIHSVAGLNHGSGLLEQRPFRAPHHTCSTPGLVGGGSSPRAGEVSLAHHGVLFLDELPEFSRQSLEALRQPLEDGEVTIVRAQHVVSFPANFMLIAAMNPCPCGYRGSEVRTCICGEAQAQRYTAKISGPLLDRFDIFVRVKAIEANRLLENSYQAESSVEIGKRVTSARRRQSERFKRAKIHSNAQMSARQLKHWVPLDESSKELLLNYAEKHAVSARALHRTCRVARTIADLKDKETIDAEDIAMALSLQYDRFID